MKKTTIRIIAIAVLLGGMAVMGSVFIDGHSESTDDAQVEQYMSPLNSRVGGYIKEVRFTEHQKVKRGDTLLIIDDSEYRIALKQARAALMDAMSGRKLAGNSVHTASTGATVHEASIEEAKVRVAKLQRDYERHSALLQRKASTPTIVEQYRAELDMARARVEALQRQRATALSSVAEVSQRRENAEAAILRAKAAVELAMLNLSYTVITAPADGYLGRRNIEAGQLIAPGQTVTTLIPAGRKWIVANFKETQAADIRPGQKVRISVDALPGTELKGVVTAISQATGSKYSAIPTDNSAGNFVKIQQRIPVRIDFAEDEDTAVTERLAAGMMCEVKVDTSCDSNV